MRPNNEGIVVSCGLCAQKYTGGDRGPQIQKFIQTRDNQPSGSILSASSSGRTLPGTGSFIYRQNPFVVLPSGFWRPRCLPFPSFPFYLGSSGGKFP